MRTESTCSLSSTQRIVFLGRNAISISAGRRLVACSSRWARPSRPLVGRRGSPDVQKQAPRPGRMRTPAHSGSAAPGGRQTKETRLSCPLHRGTDPFVRRARLPDHGVREMPKPAQVATRTPANAEDRSAADAIEPNREPVTTLDCVLQTAMVRWAEAATARQYSVSQLKLSLIPGERSHR